MTRRALLTAALGTLISQARTPRRNQPLPLPALLAIYGWNSGRYSLQNVVSEWHLPREVPVEHGPLPDYFRGPVIAQLVAGPDFITRYYAPDNAWAVEWYRHNPHENPNIPLTGLRRKIQYKEALDGHN